MPPVAAKRFRFKWWILIALVMGIGAFILAIVIDSQVSQMRWNYREQGILDFWEWESKVYGKHLDFDEWQTQKYGNQIGYGYAGYDTRRDAFLKSPEYQERQNRWTSSPEYQAQQAYFERVDAIQRIAQPIVIGMGILGALPVILWLVRGIAGGIILSIKKLRGWGWTWLVVFLTGIVIPLGLYLLYLAIMMLFGELAYYWGKNAKPSRRKCPECKAWIPYDATRCQHCVQAVPLTP